MINKEGIVHELTTIKHCLENSGDYSMANFIDGAIDIIEQQVKQIEKMRNCKNCGKRTMYGIDNCDGNKKHCVDNDYRFWKWDGGSGE